MHQNLYIRKHQYTGLAMAIIALAGCGGEGGNNTDSGGSPEFVVPATISAQNTTFITEYKDNYVVDLSDRVSVNGGHSFTLMDVKALTETAECQPTQIMAQSFTVSADSSKACDYEYTVAISQAKPVAAQNGAIAPANLTGAPTDVAITRVAVTSETPTESTEVELPAISAVTLVEQLVEVDVKEQLLLQTGQDLEGYTLSTEISLPYSTNTASVDTVRNTITYTPSGGFEGIERILFSYKNDATGEVLLGILDIAVNQIANEGMLVEDDITYSEVEINKSVTIDVAPYVTSFDGDNVQLIYVDSFNADTAPLDAEDITNTKFTFKTERMGKHYVSFAVSDNNGAYAMGLMEVPAFDPNKTRQWDGIFYQGLYFTGPLTTQEAAANQITYNDTLADNYYNPAVDLALFSAGNALNYCGLQGRLPTSDELVTLSSQNVQANHNWPVSEQYLAYDDGTYKTVELTTGLVTGYSSGNYIVSCIEGGLTVQPPTEETIANGVEEAEVVFTLLGQGEEPIVGASMTFTVDSDSGLAKVDSKNGTTDLNGQTVALVSNFRAEDTLVCAEVGTQEACTIVDFVGDPATAVISQADLDVYGWFPGDTRSYDLSVKIVDAYDNPVSNAIVSFKVTEDENQQEVELSPMMSTDDAGQVVNQVTNRDTSSTDFTSIEVSHINGLGDEDTRTIETRWGSWQWETPLVIRLTDPITWFNVTTSTCEDNFGPGYRFLTGTELNQYKKAHEAQTEFLKLNPKNPEKVDPIYGAFNGKYGVNSVVSDLEEPKWFYVTWSENRFGYYVEKDLDDRRVISYSDKISSFHNGQFQMVEWEKPKFSGLTTVSVERRNPYKDVDTIEDDYEPHRANVVCAIPLDAL
ncbi:hypothetical protein ACNO5M_27040 [Vibrio owensii]|uniref:hypothetical protein n=1 Tax=Vibrio owensii TaxID=696485 RepID=UPI003AAAA7D4